MLLLIDNYDSFTYNLYHYLGELGCSCEVLRHDALSVSEALSLSPKFIVISPGPRTPDEAGISVDLVTGAAEAGIPLFGVCLGMQCIARAFGGRIIRHSPLYHGKVSRISHASSGIFSGIDGDFSATRYHSLIVERSSLPLELESTADSEDGVIMALRHKALPLYGVQFHPESIATEHGKLILGNFLRMGGHNVR